MKIIRRVPIHKGVDRLIEPNPSSVFSQKMVYNIKSPYQLSVDNELFKYNFRVKSYHLGFFAAAVIGYLLGTTLDNFDKTLTLNEVQTVYNYRLRQTTQSSVMLNLRMIWFKLISQLVVGKLLPYMEYQMLSDIKLRRDQKFVRLRQYRHFMEKKDRKYDIMELGVLEKFPYPHPERKP